MDVLQIVFYVGIPILALAGIYRFMKKGQKVKKPSVFLPHVKPGPFHFNSTATGRFKSAGHTKKNKSVSPAMGLKTRRTEVLVEDDGDDLLEDVVDAVIFNELLSHAESDPEGEVVANYQEECVTEPVERVCEPVETVCEPVERVQEPVESTYSSSSYDSDSSSSYDSSDSSDCCGGCDGGDD